ncbi:MAG: hypothetical protein EZS28_001319 [Streblomastix strix]|uniref:Uncharacterized protein n=1 Tax=Streblomastix strix TaxID=222440 RepID=A0A5J4X7C5_9EUKA|nr:MAG: hypothetical protein EZS28_001319 [Streblomastix strix]
MNISAPQDSSIRVEIVFKLSGLHPLRSPQCQFIRREGIPQPVSRRWEMLAASMMNQSGKVSSVSGSIGGQNTGIGSGLSTGASLASAASVLVANKQQHMKCQKHNATDAKRNFTAAVYRNGFILLRKQHVLIVHDLSILEENIEEEGTTEDIEVHVFDIMDPYIHDSYAQVNIIKKYVINPHIEYLL